MSALVPPQRIPIPPLPLIQEQAPNQYVISLNDAVYGTHDVYFPKPKVGTAWLLQGYSVQFGGAGLGGSSGTPEGVIYLKRGGEIIATITTFTGLSPLADNVSGQLVQPVVIYDTESVSLSLGLQGGSGLFGHVEIQRASLQVIYA